MVLKNFLAVVVFEIISNLVSMRNSLNAYNCWHKQNFENCPTLLIVGIPTGFRGIGDFWKSSVRGGLEPIAILGGNDLFRGNKFFSGGLRACHVNLETFFNLSSIVVVSKPFVGAFLFVFLDDIALNQQTSFFLNLSFLIILFIFQLK